MAQGRRHRSHWLVEGLRGIAAVSLVAVILTLLAFAGAALLARFAG